MGLTMLCGVFASLNAGDSSADEVSEAVRWVPMDASNLDPEWRMLFERMRSVERVSAPFVEERYFSFRKKPKVYHGVFRKSTDGSVSLAYSDPEVMALHVGEGFAFYRKGEGPVRRIPQGHGRGELLEVLPRLLRLDLAKLTDDYELMGAWEETSWRLRLIAKRQALDSLPYSRIELGGEDAAVRRIELCDAGEQRIVIELGQPVYPEFYSQKSRADYFFHTE